MHYCGDCKQFTPGECSGVPTETRNPYTPGKEIEVQVGGQASGKSVFPRPREGKQGVMRSIKGPSGVKRWEGGRMGVHYCPYCEWVATTGEDLKGHIKAKHLKEIVDSP